MNKYLLIGLAVVVVLGACGLYLYLTPEPVMDEAVVETVQPVAVKEDQALKKVVSQETPSLQVLNASLKAILFSYSNMPLAHVQLVKKGEEPNVTGGADRMGIEASQKVQTIEWNPDSDVPAGTYILRAMKWDPLEGDPDAVLFETDEFYFPGS